MQTRAHACEVVKGKIGGAGQHPTYGQRENEYSALLTSSVLYHSQLRLNYSIPHSGILPSSLKIMEADLDNPSLKFSP